MESWGSPRGFGQQGGQGKHRREQGPEHESLLRNAGRTDLI